MLSSIINESRGKPTKIIMFCGKGGVGKTTCASTTAIYYAQNGNRTLLISTDPTPSLSDILEINVEGIITPVIGVNNLSAVELNYDSIVKLWIKKYGQEVYEVISSFLPVEKDIIDYISGAPGIDEEFALSYLYDLYSSGEYDVIVWDTAPAGGTLSLLHIQETFYMHIKDAASLYIQIKETFNALKGKERKDPLKIIGIWEQLAKNVLNMIRSPDTIAFIITIPEALGIAQTKRLEKELKKFGVNIGGIIVNYYLTDEDSKGSDLFNARKEIQKKYVGMLEESYKNILPIVTLSYQYFEVKGISALKRIVEQLFI